MSDYRTEVIEAIRAADDALFYLNRAKNSLTNARNWGIYDMIGGGFFSTAIKRNKMSDSQMYMDDANVALRKLERELMDVNQMTDLGLDTNSFLSFADFFFDGFFVDWIVQGKINEARQKIEDTIRTVEDIRYNLRLQL